MSNEVWVDKVLVIRRGEMYEYELAETDEDCWELRYYDWVGKDRTKMSAVAFGKSEIPALIAALEEALKPVKIQEK